MRYFTNATYSKTRGTAIWAGAFAILLFAVAPSNAEVINGDFSSGLDGWTTAGDVSESGCGAVGDNGVFYSLLFQPVALTPGNYAIEFDFLGMLSGDLTADPFAFPDAFFASLYFTDDLGTLDIENGVFDDVAPLFDLDEFGPYNASGTFGVSSVGPDWTHFVYEFTNSHNYVIPAFELLDFNYISNDSQVCLDNVTLSSATGVVPEPATLSLFAMGILGLAARRARKTHNV